MSYVTTGSSYLFDAHFRFGVEFPENRGEIGKEHPLFPS
jgi:hypothetical protein